MNRLARERKNKYEAILKEYRKENERIEKLRRIRPCPPSDKIIELESMIKKYEPDTVLYKHTSPLGEDIQSVSFKYRDKCSDSPIIYNSDIVMTTRDIHGNTIAVYIDYTAKYIMNSNGEFVLNKNKAPLANFPLSNTQEVMNQITHIREILEQDLDYRINRRTDEDIRKYPSKYY